jgi:hypothetical protein
MRKIDRRLTYSILRKFTPTCPPVGGRAFFTLPPLCPESKNKTIKQKGENHE